MISKRGQSQMTLGTILGIVLGIVVLVLLIWGFSQGWSNMWDKVSGRTSSSNVQDKIVDCQTDCDNGEIGAWCNEKKDLKFFDDEGNIVKVSGTCDQFSRNGIMNEHVHPENPYQTKAMGFDTCSKFKCQ